MENPTGISFEIGNDDFGWFCYIGKLKPLKVRPSREGVDARYGGFKFDIVVGRVRRPVPRFYKPEFWSRDYVKKEQETNPWNSGKHWFIFTLPVFLGFFVSACMGRGEGQPGFYLGFKTYKVNKISQNLKIYKSDRDDIITNAIAWGDESEKGSVYLCPSGSVREDLVD